jgi:enoyl-CoA hydratase
MSIQFSPSDDVRHALIDGVLSVMVDRPEKRNPLSLGVLDRLRRIFTDTANNALVSVAVLTGAGSKAFSAGGDLAELSNYRGRDDADALSRHGKAALDAIRFFPVPVIARWNGVALGGGAELALACDLRFASASSKFGFVHGRLRISPPWGGSKDLVRIVGAAKALRLLATAAILNAEEGEAMGLIDLVCPKEREFDAWFEERLLEFRKQPPQLMRAYKAITLSSRTPESTEAERLETDRFCELWCHEDHWNAVAQLERETR